MTHTAHTITADNAEELAHTYYLYRTALERRQYAGTTIYGDWLISMQKRMGATLIDPQAIRAAIATADQHLEAEEA